MQLHGKEVESFEEFSPNVYKVHYVGGGWGLAHEDALQGHVLPSVKAEAQSKWDKIRKKNEENAISAIQSQQEEVLPTDSPTLSPSEVREMMLQRLVGG